MSGYVKDFDGWHPIKKAVGNSRIPTFNQREIWWCTTGVNIGVEQDGKNHTFERPILIVRKFNRRLFWVIPLTSKVKPFPHYVTISFKSTKDVQPWERSFIVSQMRSFDATRLSRKMGKLTDKQFQLILDEIHRIM